MNKLKRISGNKLVNIKQILYQNIIIPGKSSGGGRCPASGISSQCEFNGQYNSGKILALEEVPECENAS